MTRHMAPRALTLFDLIARDWSLDAPVAELCFNAASTTLAARTNEGRLAFLRVEDAEAPDTRLREELETGRATIRPRARPLPPPRLSEPLDATGLCAEGDTGFVFIRGDEVWRATAGGQVLRKLAGDSPVTALCPTGLGLAVARGRTVTWADALHRLTHGVSVMAAAPDGAMLACCGGGRLTLLGGPPVTLPGGEITTLAWSADGRWLIGGGTDRALTLVDLASGAADRVEGFAAPVAAVAVTAGALLAAGGFRIVGWRMPDLPFGGQEGTPLETGRPGFTVIETIAAHPRREICAAGYANGLVTIAQVGSREEMLLRDGTGAAVTALQWSADGKHLGIGTADGRAAIATFPRTMFK